MEDVLVGAIVGLAVGTSIYVMNSESFSKAQKVFLLICFIFPPLQWLSIIIISIYNYFRNQRSSEAIELKKHKKETLNSQRQIEHLRDLRNQDIITKEEFDNKVKTIQSSQKELELLRNEEYKKLKELFDNEVLSHSEFENKVEVLRRRLEFNENNLSPLNNTLKSNIIGRWDSKYSYIIFTKDTFTFAHKNSDSEEITVPWIYDFNQKRLLFEINSKQEYFQILNLTTNELVYRHRRTKFKFSKSV